MRSLVAFALGLGLVFTVGCSIPIALVMGLYIHKVRGGTPKGIKEATAFGVILLFAALIQGTSTRNLAILSQTRSITGRHSGAVRRSSPRLSL